MGQTLGSYIDYLMRVYGAASLGAKDFNLSSCKTIMADRGFDIQDLLVIHELLLSILYRGLFSWV